MYTRFIFLIALLWPALSTAQQFWMRPDKFTYRPGDTVRISFYVGENLIGETWNLRKARIRRLELMNGEEVRDLSELVNEGKSRHLKFVVDKPGTYVVVMESNNSFIEIDAVNFNAYLKENALDDALNARKKNSQLEKPGREYYARVAKTIIQVGDSTTHDYDRSTGLSVDIIPMHHPQEIKVGDAPVFRILHAGRPLFGARAYVWNNQNTRTYSQPIYTKQDGTLDTRIFNPGLWMVSVVTMVPADGTQADWQSYWSTLLIEVQK